MSFKPEIYNHNIVDVNVYYSENPFTLSEIDGVKKIETNSEQFSLSQEGERINKNSLRFKISIGLSMKLRDSFFVLTEFEKEVCLNGMACYVYTKLYFIFLIDGITYSLNQEAMCFVLNMDTLTYSFINNELLNRA